MWTVLKAVALRLAIGRTLGGMLATLFLLLVPLAGVLKVIGLPILIVLGIVGAPVFLLLAAIGLPVLVVVGFGSVLMLLVGGLLALGVLAIKIALPIILIVWLVKWWRGKPPSPEVPPSEPGVEGIP
ncbi:MAG TPA: hypothetical protein VFS59_04305 [Gemmatimonadaceae bacterium]|nr:hypothetical protein [Gemmatimonadaceae bacterium]